MAREMHKFTKACGPYVPGDVAGLDPRNKGDAAVIAQAKRNKASVPWEGKPVSRRKSLSTDAPIGRSEHSRPSGGAEVKALEAQLEELRGQLAELAAAAKTGEKAADAKGADRTADNAGKADDGKAAGKPAPAQA